MKRYLIVNDVGIASVMTTNSDTPPQFGDGEFTIEIVEIDEEEAMQVEEEQATFLAAALDPAQDLPKRARHKRRRRRGEKED